MSSMVDVIKDRLSGRSQAEWRAIAERAGVPYPTLEKIIYGTTPNPRIGTVEPLFRVLEDEARAQPAGETGAPKGAEPK